MGSKKSKTTETYKPPSWIQDSAKQANRLGQKIGSQKYEAYTGDRVAGLSENERMGMEMARDNVGIGQPYFNQSEAMIQRGTQQFADADMSQYMNPYIKGALDPAAREIREEGQREANRLDSRSASMDAFGGSRAALMRSENREKTLQSVQDLYGKGYAMAYESAVNIWGDERARDMQAADRFRSLGDTVSNASRLDIATLMTTGATDRNIQQAMRDFDYQQFVEERDWDMRNLSGLIAALEGTKGSYQTSKETTSKQSGGEVAQALGLAATMVGAFFTGGTSLAVGGVAKAAAGGAGGAMGGSAVGNFASGVPDFFTQGSTPGGG